MSSAGDGKNRNSGSFFIFLFGQLLVSSATHTRAASEYIVTAYGGSTAEKIMNVTSDDQKNSPLPNKTMSITNIAPEDALSPFTTIQVKGDYVASGVGLRGKTSGTIVMSGIPASANIEAAYLYWSFLDNGPVEAEKNISFNGIPIVGTKIGSGRDTCWGRSASRSFRADVTSLVCGNGFYRVSEVPSQFPLLAQGVSLVVVYQDDDEMFRTIIIKDGNGVIDGANSRLSTVLNGFVASPDQGDGLHFAKTTFIVGDGQNFTDVSTLTGGRGTATFLNMLDASDGALWDTDTYNVSSFVAPGDISIPITISRGTDCLNWVAQTFSVVSEVETENHVPSFTYSPEDGYNTDPESPGVHPNKGVANKDELVFKVIYYDEDNNAPTKVEIKIDYLDEFVCETKEMILDQTAASIFHDGNYVNGEQYIYKSTFPKGKYKYSFEASDGIAETSLIENQLGYYKHQFMTGYSNVAFLPGLQASRLYKIQTFENQLWEPNRNDDVKKLYMNSDGTSSLAYVYTKDVIDAAYGFNVYKKFEDYMDDEIVNAGIIHESSA